MPSVLQTYPIQNIGGGVNQLLDATAIPDNFASDARNVTFFRQIVTKRTGFENFGNAVSGTVQKIFDFFEISRVKHTMLGSTAGVYEYDPNTNTWVNRANIQGFLDQIPTWEVFNGQLVYANGRAPLQIWDGTTSSMTPITGNGAPDTGRYVMGYLNRLLVGSPVVTGTSRPYRVMWSDFNRPTIFNSGDAGAVELIDTDDPIMGLTRISTYGVLVRRYSVWLILPTDAPAFYRFEKRVDRIGCIAPGSIQTTPMGVIYLGDDNLYMFNGVSSAPVGNALRNIFVNSINKAAVGQCVSTIDVSKSEYWLSIPVFGASTPNLIIVYNYADGYLTIHDLQFSCLGYMNTFSPMRFSDLPNPFNTYNISFDSGMLNAGFPIVVAGNGSQAYKASLTKSDFGTQIFSYFVTKLSSFGSPMFKRVERVLIVMDRPGTGNMNVQLGYSDDGSTVNYSNPVTVPVSGSQSVWVDFDGIPASMFFNLKISSTGVSDDFAIKSIVFYYRPRGAYA